MACSGGRVAAPATCYLPRAIRLPGGFSLLELLIVIAVLAILAVAASGSYFGFLRKGELDTAAQQVVAKLREAQGRSQASVDGYAWGVHFDDTNQGTNANRFVLFRGTCSVTTSTVCHLDTECPGGETCQNVQEEVNTLPSNVEIPSGGITLNGGGVDVIFSKLTGKTSKDGTGASDEAIKVQSKGNASQFRWVTVTPLGKIDTL